MVDVAAESDRRRVPGLEVVLTHDGRCSTITVLGELDLASRDVLEVTLDGVRGSGERRVVIDLADAFVDVAGLQPLEAAVTAGMAVLIRNPTTLTRKLLGLLGLERLLVIEAPVAP